MADRLVRAAVRTRHSDERQGVPHYTSLRCTDDLWSRKQSVGLAHQPIGDEADPLLRGGIEVA